MVLLSAADVNNAYKPVESATSALSNAWKNVSQFARYAGREIVVIAGKSAELLKMAVLEIAKLIRQCWQATKPLIRRAVEFMCSDHGIVSLLVLGPLLLQKLALSLDDRVAQYTLTVFAYAAFGFGMVYASQKGVIPSFFQSAKV